MLKVLCKDSITEIVKLSQLPELLNLTRTCKYLKEIADVCIGNLHTQAKNKGTRALLYILATSHPLSVCTVEGIIPTRALILFGDHVRTQNKTDETYFVCEKERRSHAEDIIKELRLNIKIISLCEYYDIHPKTHPSRNHFIMETRNKNSIHREFHSGDIITSVIPIRPYERMPGSVNFSICLDGEEVFSLKNSVGAIKKSDIKSTDVIATTTYPLEFECNCKQVFECTRGNVHTLAYAGVTVLVWSEFDTYDEFRFILCKLFEFNQEIKTLEVALMG